MPRSCNSWVRDVWLFANIAVRSSLVAGFVVLFWIDIFEFLRRKKVG